MRYANQKYHTTAQEEGTGAKHDPARTNITESAENPSEQNGKRSEQSNDKKESTDAALALYTYYLTFFTAVLAAGTIVLAIATIGLWGYATEQANDMKESIAASRIGANAAKDAADAATASVRAILSVAPQSFFNTLVRPLGVPGPDNTNSAVTYFVQNYGKSPKQPCRRLQQITARRCPPKRIERQGADNDARYS